MPYKDIEDRVDWNDATTLQQVISESKSRVEVLRRLGYHPGGCSGRRSLNQAIERFGLDVSSFTSRTDRWDILPDIIDECHSVADVLKAVGLEDKGDNHKTAKRYIGEMGLDISHFDPHGKSRGDSNVMYRTDEEIFCKGSTVHRHTVRRRIESKDLMGYECAKCGNDGRWMNRPLSLQLEHKNGISNDNRLENLEYLCPNCHSQTKTFAGKNRSES